MGGLSGHTLLQTWDCIRKFKYHEIFVLFLTKHLQFLPCFTYSSTPSLRSEDSFTPCFCHVRTHTCHVRTYTVQLRSVYKHSHGSSLLIIDKTTLKQKTYMWVSVWWKTKRSSWGIYTSHWVVYYESTKRNLKMKPISELFILYNKSRKWELMSVWWKTKN